MQKELPSLDLCLWLIVKKKKELQTLAAQGAFVPFKSHKLLADLKDAEYHRRRSVLIFVLIN